MTLVLDASAVVDLLVRTTRGQRTARGLGRRAGEQQVTAAHLDAEVLSALARAHRAGQLEARDVTVSLRLLGDMALTRLPHTPDLLAAAWELRHNVFVKDALYVALARALPGELVTSDDRLARAVPDVLAEL